MDVISDIAEHIRKWIFFFCQRCDIHTGRLNPYTHWLLCLSVKQRNLSLAALCGTELRWIRCSAYCDLAASPLQTYTSITTSMISMSTNQGETNLTFQPLEPPKTWFLLFCSFSNQHIPAPGVTAVLYTNCLPTAEVTACDQMLHQSFVSALIRWATTEAVCWGNGCSCSDTQPREDKT